MRIGEDMGKFAVLVQIKPAVLDMALHSIRHSGVVSDVHASYHRLHRGFALYICSRAEVYII